MQRRVRFRTVIAALATLAMLALAGCGGQPAAPVPAQGAGTQPVSGGQPSSGAAPAGPSAPATKPSGPATKVKVLWAARTITSAASPFAIAKEMGWFAEEGVDVELVPIDGSTAVVQQVAAGAAEMGLPSVEPIAIGRQASKGVKMKIFYTAYQGNIYGIAVKDDSPIKSVADLKEKTIGATSLNSAAVPVARALVKSAGLDPEKDVKIVVAGEGAQSAAMLRAGQVDALAQFDTQFALVENAGQKLRLLPTPETDKFPSNGFAATDDWLAKNRKLAVAVARGYAKGTVFALANPEAAIKIFWKHYPQTKPTGKAEDVAMKEAIHVLNARAANWKLERGGVKKWGENSEANYGAYVKFLTDQGLIKEPVAAKDVVTNELIDEINDFDPAKIQEQAKSWK